MTGLPRPAGAFRVTHLITDLDVGGAERVLSRLVAASDPARIRHDVISLLPPGRIAEELAAAGCPVRSLGMSRDRTSPGAVARLWSMLRRDPAPILQTWLYHADLIGTVAGRLAGMRTIVWNIRCSDMDLSCYPRSTARVLAGLRRLSRWPAAVIANSEAGRVAHDVIGLRPRRWEVIPNGFAVAPANAMASVTARAALRRDLGLAADAPVIGMLARFDPMKDHATFLRAAAALAARRPEAAFVLAGRDVTMENPLLSRLVVEGGLVGRAHLLGERAGGDLAAIQAGLDIASLSSAFGEGCPNVIGEAMASGIPCIATRVGDTPRLIADTGTCVPPRDPTALAAAWDELLGRSPDERAALGARARARILAYFSLDAMIGRYLALYEELARR